MWSCCSFFRLHPHLLHRSKFIPFTTLAPRTYGDRHLNSPQIRPISTDTAASAFREALFNHGPDISVQHLHSKSLREALSGVKRPYELLDVLNKRVLPLPQFKSRLPSGLSEYVAAALERCEHGSTKAQSLGLLNTIIERFHHSGIPIPPTLLRYCFKVAAKYNAPAAMKEYLQTVISHPRKQQFLASLDLSYWKTVISQILLHPQSKARDWNSLRHRKAWVEVLVGWCFDDGLLIQRSFCLYDVLVQYDIEGLKSFISLVQKFCTPVEILRLWADFSIHEKPPLSTTALELMINSSISSLLGKNDPERAWQLAQIAMQRNHGIKQKNWKRLLRFPEHIGEWNPHLNNPASAALERYLKDIERTLQVVWTGGEDGYHITKHMDED